MTINYVPLPAAHLPENAKLDFSPLTGAIDQNRAWQAKQHEMMLADAQNARAQNAEGRAATNFGNQQTEFYQGQQERTQKALARRASAIKALPTERRGPAWAAYIARHPNPASLGPEYHDPEFGPDLVLAEAGMLPDPLELEEKKARIGLIGAQTENARGEAGERSRKAAFDKQIFEMISGGEPGISDRGTEPSPVPAPGTYQPQSYQGGDHGIPGLTPARGRQPAMPQQMTPMMIAAPQMLSSPTNAADAMLQDAQQLQPRPGFILAAGQPNGSSAQPRRPPAPQQRSRSASPMDGLSPQQRAAFGLGLMGKGDAGKILLDASNANRLDKSAQTDVDKAEIRATNGLARLNEISASFDPSFLTYQAQVGNWGRALIDKVGKLKPEQQAKLYKFATFRRDAARNINDAIKENSGATVTEQELARNLVELPNSGSGMFDGDSPTVFKAKIDRARETLTLGVARFRYLRQKGFTGQPWDSGIELPQMREIINQRAQEIMGQLKQQNPQADPALLEQEADLRVKQEFGI